MRVSGPRRTEIQPRLFAYDRPVDSLGAKRAIVGNFFENATAKVSGAVPLRTDSRCDICPDLRFDETTFFECKAVGKTGTVIVYEERLKKDGRFIRQTGNQLFYWLWRHDYTVNDAHSEAELKSGIASHLLNVTIVRHEALLAAIEGKPVRVVNAAKGGAYHSGWCVPVKRLAAQCLSRERTLPETIVDECTLSNVPVRRQSRVLTRLFP